MAIAGEAPHVALAVTAPMAKQAAVDSQGAPRQAADDVIALGERAAIAARAELRGERTGILGAIGEVPLRPLARPRQAPSTWTFLYVMERMEEAFRVLGRLPMATRPRGYVNSMPIYLHDRGDLNSQLETHELERMATLRNHVRIPPTPAEIGRMEEALHWPTAFLEENRKLQDRRYADNSAALRDLGQKLDKHAAAVEVIRPTVAAL
ncbi:MAG: hypothetical protein WB624_22425, partial [Xanthobacteraceae bacterium]